MQFTISYKINDQFIVTGNEAVSHNANSTGKAIKNIRSFTLLLFVFVALGQGFLFSQLDKLYRSGVIKMTADTTFGMQTDWENLFYDMYKSLAIAADGSIFISNDRQNTIYKLSTTGKLLTQWGQSGAGPSDLTNPGDLSVLDDKYLVVGEYGTLRRISMFNLDGKYEKILKTNHSCFSPQALKENSIAYYSIFAPNNKKEKITVWVKNILTGKETPVTVVEIPTINQIKDKTGYTLSINNHSANLILARTVEGNLLVGVSNQSVINIYSPIGKWLSSFRLNITPLPINPKYINEYKQKTIKDMREKKGAGVFLEIAKKASFEKLFPSHLPYYRTIYVDSVGNILVFRWLDCVTDCPIKFQVYSSEGIFQNEVLLDPGSWDIEIANNWDRLIFNNKGIFALVQLKGDNESPPRIIKIKVPTER